MTKPTAKSQQKNISAQSVAVEYLGNGIFNLRFTMSDGSKSAVGFFANEIEAIVAQIEAAIAENVLKFHAPNGRVYDCQLAALQQAHNPLVIISRGGSGVHVVAGGVSDNKKKQAPAAKRPLISENSPRKIFSLGANKRNGHKFVGSSCGKSSSFFEGGDAADTDLQPRRDTLKSTQINKTGDAISAPDAVMQSQALLRDCAQLRNRTKRPYRCRDAKARRAESSKSIVTDSPSASGGAHKGNSLPKGWRQCNVENPRCNRVKTKRGRTSVVVATSKVF